MSCMCLIFKTKFFLRFIATVMDREKADVLRINGMQINKQFVFKSLQSIEFVMYKKIIHFILAFGFPLLLLGQLPQGAWNLKTDNGDLHKLMIVDGFFSWTVYRDSPAAFVSAKGGQCSLNDQQLKFHFEFNTADTSEIGTSRFYHVTIHQNELWLKDEKQTWHFGSIENDIKAPLHGAWLFYGRERNGELSFVNTNRPRKTMKLLTNNHFQWIAYNVATKQFFGTGGGTFTAENEIYTESIEFFSRDNQKVGLELSFQFDVKGEEWHHKGKSSKGDPMYEVWKQRAVSSE